MCSIAASPLGKSVQPVHLHPPGATATASFLGAEDPAVQEWGRRAFGARPAHLHFCRVPAGQCCLVADVGLVHSDRWRSRRKGEAYQEDWFREAIQGHEGDEGPYPT